jgi:hypothetical protein
MKKLNITTETIQSMVDLYNNGMVLLDIAKKFSLSYGFIHSLINKNKKMPVKTLVRPVAGVTAFMRGVIGAHLSPPEPWGVYKMFEYRRLA